MTQIMKGFFFLAVTILLVSYCKSTVANPRLIEVKNGDKPFLKMMYLNKKHSTMGVIIRENTLNDTALMWTLVKIPPKKTGLLLRVDCFVDSMAFSYQPYKATKGKLVVEYYSKAY